MFRNILTPLTSKFPFQLPGLENAEPIAPIIEEEDFPEDFVKDARIEEMRLVLEDMKTVDLDDITRKFQVNPSCRTQRRFPGYNSRCRLWPHIHCC